MLTSHGTHLSNTTAQALPALAAAALPDDWLEEPNPTVMAWISALTMGAAILVPTLGQPGLF